jgi:diguanylate cyclase (GGDEF)-like protein
MDDAGREDIIPPGSPISPESTGPTLVMLTRYFRDPALALFRAVASRKHRKINRLATPDHTQFFAAAECTLDDFYIFDGIPDSSGAIVDFRFSYINPNAERRLGVRRDTLYGKVLTEVRPFMIKSGLIHKYREVVRTGIPYTCEVHIDDEMIKGTWLNVQVVRLGNGIAITSRDVTEHRRRSDHVHYLAHHDQLTGLANRTLLHERLRQAILRAQNHGQRVAVFLIDIDYFKQINDSLGHVDGDVLLTTVGQRLLSSVREYDTVARMGGDEFVIVMPEFHTIRDVEQCGEQIVINASQPVEIGARKISLTLSVGVSMFPEGGRTAEELLRNADAAMYTVKDSGGNSVCVFDNSLMTEHHATALNGAAWSAECNAEAKNQTTTLASQPEDNSGTKPEIILHIGRAVGKLCADPISLNCAQAKMS